MKAIWKQVTGKAKENWGKLTDDDLDVVAGRRDQLAGKIQGRSGVAKDHGRVWATNTLPTAVGECSLTNPLCVTVHDAQIETSRLNQRCLRKLTMPGSGNGPTIAGERHGRTEAQRQDSLITAAALQSAIFNSVSFSSIATDAKGVIQVFNVGAERMLGYVAADVVDRITPADISDPQEVIERARTLTAELGTTIAPGFEALAFKAARGIEDIYELTHIRKDGSRFPAVVSVTALRDAQDAIIGYLLIGTDNTARKQAEAVVQAAAQYARSLIEASLDPLVTISPEGKITDVNEGSVAVTGVPRERLIGADFSDYFTEPEKAREGYREAFLKGSVTDYPLTIRHENGRLTDVLYNASVYKDARGSVLGVFAAARDNTARKQAEAGRQQLLLVQEETNRQLEQANITLRESEGKLAVTLNSIGDAVIATDAQARVTLMNPLAEHLTGWTQAQAAGRAIGDVFHIINQSTRQLAAVPVLQTLAHGTIQGLANHTIVISRDGTECAIADSCAPIRSRDGQIVGAVLVFRDVTEEYAVQQALHDKNVELESARDLADKANLAKSEFLSSMSHELRTPLNAILGFTQLMESASPPPTVTQKRQIDQILKAGWYLLELINEILDLALIESGTATLSPEAVSLVEVMLECRTMIEPQAQKRGISMAFPRFEGPCYVSADRTRVKQVLINLLFNAIKYNRPAGSVVVEYALSSPTSIRIRVRDTGQGLDSVQLGQLFQPFNRLGREASAEEGTGIGLMVTKRLVELMGGTIGVESTVGVGSVFWFELNLTDAPPPVAAQADPAPSRAAVPEGTPLRNVLYVEDNPANLELVEQLIARRPELRLLSAVDGILGVEFARVYQPHVILMDINLPGISGLEAMRRLRAHPATAHIPVIALSANAVPRDIEKALEAGFFRYLTKPIKVNQFMEALDAALIVATTDPEPAAEEKAV